MVAIVAKGLALLTSLYMILCAVRVFMSWAPGMTVGSVGIFIAKIVDPYLRFFSRLRLFRSERFDFSPIIALSLLSVVNNLFATLAYSGRISVGLLLGLVFGAVWSALSFVLSFLAVCAALRILVFLFKWNSLHPVWNILDSILNPVLYRINKAIYRIKPIDYLQGLVTGFIVLLLFRTAGGALAKILSTFLISLPF